jgi:hypothetical protein
MYYAVTIQLMSVLTYLRRCVCTDIVDALSVKWNCTRSKMVYLRHPIIKHIEIRPEHTQ